MNSVVSYLCAKKKIRLWHKCERRGVCLCVYLRICEFVCACICISVCVFVSACVSVSVNVWVWVCACVFVCVYKYVCVSICTQTCCVNTVTPSVCAPSLNNSSFSVDQGSLLLSLLTQFCQDFKSMLSGGAHMSTTELSAWILTPLFFECPKEDSFSGGGSN